MFRQRPATPRGDRCGLPLIHRRSEADRPPSDRCFIREILVLSSHVQASALGEQPFGNLGITIGRGFSARSNTSPGTASAVLEWPGLATPSTTYQAIAVGIVRERQRVGKDRLMAFGLRGTNP